jgi:hypothetical protein
MPMKTLILAIFCLANSLCYSQIYKFRAFQTAMIESDNPNSVLKWNDVNILTVINLNKDKIQIYAKSSVDIDLLSGSKAWLDENGNAWAQYNGIDESGQKCLIQWEVFKDQEGRHTSNLIIIYSDGHLIYRLKKPED